MRVRDTEGIVHVVYAPARYKFQPSGKLKNAKPGLLQCQRLYVANIEDVYKTGLVLVDAAVIESGVFATCLRCVATT